MGKPIWTKPIIGTDLSEELGGTAKSDLIWGLIGDDRLYGKGGDDTLYGGAGNDVLDGGIDRDVMFGGAGDDTYRVDNAGDVVSEMTTSGQDDGGIDTVSSTISYKLGGFLEKLILAGTAAIDGAGNALDNNIKGNDASNVLFGDDGVDTLYGYDGNDVLIGGFGRDFYYGGLGADTFVLKSEGAIYDKIYDYSAGDKLGIVASEFGLSEGAGFNGGVLDAGYFVTGSAATAIGHGQFVFDAVKAELFWDADGAGKVKSVRLAQIVTSTTLSADQFIAFGAPESASVSVATMETSPRAEDDGSVYFKLALSQAASQDVMITCSTVDGTAIGGQDFTALSSFSVLIKAGQTTAYVPVSLLNDNMAEGVESFSLMVDAASFAGGGNAVAIGLGIANTSITDEGPSVVAVHDLVAMGMIDPSAVAYNPFSNSLIMSDSEVDEAPFSRPVDLFSVGLDGSAISSTAMPFTTEATGLAYDATRGNLYITDDDKYKVIAVSADNPTVIKWSFTTKNLGGNDPEDIAVDTNTGNLFIVNGIDRKIIEVDNHGTTQISSFVLPTMIVDPEALAFDSANNVFYVGGGFSDLIWKLDRNGNVIDTITALTDLRSADHDYRVAVKDIEIAPASDGSGEMHLYVADYGLSHVADGRLIEIDLGDSGWLIV
ncbi:Calx-beta domain-containing protein [Cypionkella psychrotolerans]|uniref:Calx-beta domain-containing protein n=1 Tax=Cypionkella psychrotolerans TaxID=1678131 RepID=UPI0006B53195|nr:Calx-beta domain-containing protein [Cypionkella psychrotolerans]